MNYLTCAHLPAIVPLLFTLALTGLPSSAATPPKRPNVLLIISDDQAWSDYGFMGHPHIQTPRLDKLAADSLTFTRGYTPVPLCRPSLASIITGLHPHQHRVTGNDPDLPDKRANPQMARRNPEFTRYYETIITNFARHPNFVRDLSARGYRTFQTGKWWEGDPVKTAGFTHAMTLGTGKGDRHGGAGLQIGRDGLEPITRFIAESGDQPWLVWYAPMLPHDPHNPPAALLEKYLKLAPTEPVARYWANVEWFDRTCGDLLTNLETNGLRKDTIVLYTTDNGWLQKPDQAGRFAPRSKNTGYEGGIRTPILISWPGEVHPRRETRDVASNIDLWPTLAALLKTPTPPGLPGINLLDPDARARRQTIFGEQYAHNIADVDHPTQSLEARWIISGEWKLIVPQSKRKPAAAPELYHVVRDPWETNNLAGPESRRAQSLQSQMDAWWKP